VTRGQWVGCGRSAYGQSKLAQIMFCQELQRRLGGGASLRCVSVHPGNVLTDVVRSLPGSPPPIPFLRLASPPSPPSAALLRSSTLFFRLTLPCGVGVLRCDPMAVP
jgi:NAD(P)-dependent dehydrogenase (short-subunit alcohol dehydrogenase family)